LLVVCSLIVVNKRRPNKDTKKYIFF
jgi:hypothetical protein